MHYPQERWFAPTADGKWPEELLNPELHAFYPDGEIDGEVLVDLNSGNGARGICALPYTRLRDGAQTFFPVNIIGNLYVSNGMAAGNTMMEARSQALSEIFERHIKYRIISEGLCLPEVPDGFFGLETLGADMQGSAMHQTLLAAYDKLFAADR